MLQNARVWSLVSIDGDRQYGGNTGYEDDPKRIYRYDNSVANHKQLAPGDLVLVRNRSTLLGISIVERIASFPSTKVRQQCPVCSSIRIKARQTLSPRWKCATGHTFDTPASREISNTGYEAHYGTRFIETPNAMTLPELKSAALRPNDQLSIEELDIARLEEKLIQAFPETRSLIGHFLQTTRAADPALLRIVPTAPYNTSMSDTRRAVLRTIRERHGQAEFRQSLVKRHGAACMVSSCPLMDIVEAAHIWPYRGKLDNHPDNGLLLRADIHTLYDLDLMAIEPDTLIVRFHPAALQAGYYEFEGRVLRSNQQCRPADVALVPRWRVFMQCISQASLPH